MAQSESEGISQAERNQILLNDIAELLEIFVTIELNLYFL